MPIRTAFAREGATRRAFAVAALALLAALLTLLAVQAPQRILRPGAGFAQGVAACFVFLLGSVGASAVTYLTETRGALLAADVTRALVERFERKLSRLHPLARQRFSSGQLKNNLATDVHAVGTAVSSVVSNAIPVVAISLVCLPFVFVELGWLGVLGAGLLFSQLAFSHVLGKAIERLEGRSKTDLDAMLALAGEWLRNMRLVRALGWSGAFERRMAERVRRYVHSGAKVHVLTCLVFGTSFSWWMVPLTGMLLASVLVREPPEPAALFGASWLLSHLSKYTQHLPYTLTKWAQARVSLRRLAALDDAPEAIAYLEAGAAPGPFGGAQVVAVEFEGVELEVEGRMLLRIPELRIPLARKTLIAGTVGAGKSLLLQLFLGRLPPTRGRVLLVDEHGEKRSIAAAGVRVALHERVALVEQEPFLSSDTLSFNVALLEEAEERSVLESLQKAEFAADLEVFPARLATVVGETGVNLSGGQKQRVNLARALHARRDVWVFDDPLSAVDGHTEARLVETLRAHRGGIVLVTHRLDGAEAFDHALVIEGGEVVEQGAPPELLARPDSRLRRLREGEEAP